MRIEHIAINVEDPVAMAQWYCEHLGMQVVREGPAPINVRFIADATGQVILEIYNNPAATVPDYASMDPLMLHFAFKVDDVPATRQRLMDAGATPVGDVDQTPAGDEIAMLRDPWNVPIQFVKRAEAML